MKNTALLEQLETIENLPTLPVIVNKIQQLLSSDHSNMAQIALYISRDQAIATKVIRLVNSAFFGLRNRVASIQQAIVLLGLNTVTNIVIGISVVKSFSNSSSGSLFDREMFWFHSFGSAMGAKMIARKLGKNEPEDYFLAGLLHDIGILVLEQFFHDDFVEMLKIIINEKYDFTDAERNVFGVTHQEVGAFLANKWKLPPILTHSIGFHHNPFTAPSDTTERMNNINYIVHIADVTANNRGIHYGLPTGHKKYSNNIFDIIKISEDDLENIYSVVDSEVRSLAKEWGV